MGIFSNNSNLVINQQNQVFNKKQLTVFSKSLLIAVLGFIAICIISLISYFGVLKNYQNKGQTESLLIVMLVMFFVSFISTMAWSWFTKLDGKSFVVWGYVAWISYVISQGIAFGAVYTLLSGGEIASIFSVAVAIYGSLAFIGTRIKDKTAITLGKILMWTMILCFAFFFISLIASVVIGLTIGVNSHVQLFASMVGIALFSVLILISVVLTFKHLFSVSEFTKLSDSNQAKLIEWRLIWLLGFNILAQFIALLWQIIRLYLIFGKR